MCKILFLTTRNVLTTSGELRLIKNRAIALKRNWDIQTDFIIISNKKRLNKRNEFWDFDNEETIISYSRWNILGIYFGLSRAKKVLEKKLNKKYKMVVLSGFGTMKLAGFLRKRFPNIKLVSDIHGSNEDVLQFSSGKNFIYRARQRYIYNKSNKYENKNMKYMDGVFVVSNGLKKYLENRCKIKEINAYIVPCSIKYNDFNISTYFDKRKFYREKYNIKDDCILFVYSGGVSPWQCIEETIDCYKKYKRKLKFDSKLLILSHQKDYIVNNFNLDDEIIIDSYTPIELKNVLFCGDFAFMIRKNCITNNVAYPNKFLEYVQSGMKILTTPYVLDVSDQVRKYNIGYILEDNGAGVIDFIENNFAKHNDFEDRKKLLEDTSFDIRLLGFINDFFESGKR